MELDKQPTKKPRSSLKKNFALQASYQVLLILVPLVTTPYLSRVLGAESVGVFSYTQAVASYFVMFAMLGMSTYGVREIAAAGDDREARSKVFWSAWVSQVLVGVVVCIVYCIYMEFGSQPGGWIVGLMWGMYVVSAPLDCSWLLFGVEEFKVPTIRSFVTKLATLPIIFLFVHGPDDLWLYCAAIAGSALANQLLIWPFVKRYVVFYKPSWIEVKRHFAPSLVLFVPVIAISLYTSLDKILLGQIAGMQQAGFFEYSEKLSKMPMAVVTAMGTVMLPRMTAELSAGNRGKALSLLEDSIWAMLAMSFALAFGIMAISQEFAPVFLGWEFAECAPIMCLLAIIIPLISATNVIGRQYLVPTGRDRLYTLSVCLGAAVNVGVNLVLIPVYGAMGAAVATVAAEATVLISQSIMVRKELPLLTYVRNALPFLVCGVLMLICVRVAELYIRNFWGVSPLGLVVEILVGVVSFALFAFIWCVVSKDAHFRKLVGGFHKGR